ncbi:MAG: metallophosphoesterase [Polyangiaceae bacterium]|nr:metallophosphoesterase [Polyangiaceae bacterium]
MARTLIVGDVHGCSRELADLLDQAAFGADDRLVLVGDLVARGPDSAGVLALARRAGALGVRGNHELRLLEARAARLRGERGPRLGPSQEALLGELTDEDWAQLEALPLWLELDEHEARVVHAGLVPGVPVEEQDPWVLTRIRGFEDDGAPTSKLRAKSWAERWRGSPHVVFGHNAIAGLQLHSHATGLDTGCVYGGRLTALVLPHGARVPRKADRADALVSVRARRVYAPLGE